MMPQRDFVAPVGGGGRIERAASHIGAERTRVWFFSYVEDYFAYARFFYYIFYVQSGAQILYGLHFFFVETEPHIDRNRDKFVFFGVKSSHRGKYAEQSDAVFAARQSDGDFVALFYHIVIFRRPAGFGQ